MGRGPSKRSIEKLAAEIAEFDRVRRDIVSDVDDERLTESERAFSVLADSKGKRLFRHGWPDFLVHDPDTGSTICVEVKLSGNDRIRASQRTMFAVLDAIGMRVMVWTPGEPHRLVPWQKWEQQNAPAVTKWEGPRARQPVLGRLKTIRWSGRKERG